MKFMACVYMRVPWGCETPGQMGKLRPICHPELKRGVEGCGLGLQRQEGSPQGGGKAGVWKISICWTLVGSSLSLPPSSRYPAASVVSAPFLEQVLCLNAFRPLEESKIFS